LPCSVRLLKYSTFQCIGPSSSYISSYCLLSLCDARSSACFSFLHYAYTYPAPYRHMIKYKYVPFDIGRKARYVSK
jgi:hypothetical protein